VKTSPLPSISLLAMMYGSTLVASRFSVGQFAPLTFVGLRLLLAGLCYVAIYAASGKRAWPADRQIWRHATVMGILGTAIPMSLIVSSLQYQSSGITALLLTAGPAITVLMAHFWLPDEHLSRRKILGVALAIAGATALILQGETGLPDVASASPVGYMLVLVAMVTVSGATIYARRNMRELDSFDVSSVRIWTAATAVLPVAFLVTRLDLSRVTASGHAVLVYAGLVGTFGGMLLEFRTIQRFGATATAMTANLIPIVALFAGALLLGEQITPGMLVAMVMILSGVTIITRAEPEAVLSSAEY
jgi:drug/metabolite transporter (DMT)-like permease